jgi:hypothetical protein
MPASIASSASRNDVCGASSAQHAEHAQLVSAGAADRRAHVERIELRQLFEIFLDEIGQFEQQVLPLKGLDLAPWPFEGAAGGRDRAVDILGIALGDGGEQFSGGRVVRLEALAGCGVDPFAVDQHLLVGTIRIGMARHRYRLRHSHVCTPLMSIGFWIVISRILQRPHDTVKRACRWNRAWDEDLPCRFMHGRHALSTQ